MVKSLEKNSLIKIVILGDTSSGKTSITQRFIFDTYNSPYLNSASKVRSMELEGKSAVFSVWDDIPIFLRQVEPNYLLSRTDGAIIVFDTTSESSLLKASAILESLKEYSSTHPAVILVGNKCDEISDKVSIILEQGHMLSQKYNISYAVISAKNGHNVEEVFQFLGRIIMLDKKEDCNIYTSRKDYDYVYEMILWFIAFIGGSYLISCIK